MLRLAERSNIVGVKDCCSDPEQTRQLIRDRPDKFAVLTGEDKEFFAAIAQGADGGIHASTHVLTEQFFSVRSMLSEGDLPGALSRWQCLSDVPRLLFSEPSPAPIKVLALA